MGRVALHEFRPRVARDRNPVLPARLRSALGAVCAALPGPCGTGCGCNLPDQRFPVCPPFAPAGEKVRTMSVECGVDKGFGAALSPRLCALTTSGIKVVGSGSASSLYLPGERLTAFNPAEPLALITEPTASIDAVIDAPYRVHARCSLRCTATEDGRSPEPTGCAQGN